MLCGVLALQGAFQAHQRVLQESCKVDACLVRDRGQLAAIDALVLPGGESTAIGHLLKTSSLWQPVGQRIKEGMPVLATCAGLILLARSISNFNHQDCWRLLDVTVMRNGYGRQLDSSIKNLTIPVLGEKDFPAYFIRAPRITTVDSNVEILATLDSDAVLVRQGRILAATFHGEISSDDRLHNYFVSQVCKLTTAAAN